MICGKILLNKSDWEITYICDLCYEEVLTLPELLKHVFHEHVKGVPEDKLQEFCGNIEQEQDVGILPESLMQQEIIANQLGEKEKKVEQDERETEEDNYQDDKHSLSSSEIDNPVQNAEFEFFDIEQSGKNEKCISNKSIPCGIECNVCYEKFRNSRALMEHKKIHGDKPYICIHCGYGFADKRNMQVHSFRHLGIKPHSCMICKKTFTTSTELKIHMRHHTGERPYDCRECKKTFKSAAHLASHRRRHTNERPYLCNVCGKSFLDNKTLKDHIAIHVAKRPYHCLECNANFKLPRGLRQHMQLHSSVKRYCCRFCDKQFAQQAGLYSHEKTHNNETKKNKQ